ncbi:MAG: CotH kinase family protein [Oscillospiraceae bacterium]|nr:CotH kinase family protein [Oscillospiraceae bacterium]
MKNRFLAVLLAIVMVISLLPVSALAIDSVSNGIVVSSKTYNVSPGVVEYELITNDSGLSKQQAGHVMEVTLGADTEIITGYNDYNIEAIKSGTNWGMKETTLQAQAIETRRGVNVVGAVNASFFNMANGQPIGALVMNGTVLATSGAESTFWIDSEGAAHISGPDFRVTEEMGVKEAVGGSTILVRNGEVVYPANTSEGTNPRTAVGIKADGTVVFYEVDGRQAPYSTGMHLYDLALMMKDLGCVDAMNLDGGGSSTFATQREGEANDNGRAGLTLRNRPSDGYERTVSSTIMIISNAAQTGEFDHAVLTPNSDIYTPGSKVQFAASGVDSAGGAAALPESGLSWSVQSGSELGSIDAATGEFTAAEGKTGTVTVALSYNGAVVGTAELELQWPDRLGFTNTSVSLDFGDTSDLSFNPTYKGRDVNYKDGDFVWSIVDNDELSYKYNTLVETKAANEKTGYAGNGVKDFTMALNGKLGVEQKLQYSAYGSWWNRSTGYMEVSRQIAIGENGSVNVTSVVKNTRYWTYEYVKNEAGTIVGQNEIEHTDGLQADQTFTFSIGSVKDNKFIADAGNSLRAEMSVALANNSEVTGSVNIIVGMEPYVLMDFEDHTDPATGAITSAENYWRIHVGASSGAGGSGQLTIDEMKDSLLWIRDTTNKGVVWPKNADGSEMNGIVSAAEDKNVRFGNNAMKLAWDFTRVDPTLVAVADFGFSSAVYVNAVQPTKMGMWVNIPKEHADDNSVIKAVLVGGAYPTESSALAYRQLEDDGSMTFVPGQNLLGTTTYFQYYSYNENGERSGSTLSDWAGKGWIWIEADISSLQFPINVQRGYSVRITSPQNCTKGSGYILMDNLQLIYGTNTNDTLNPVIDSVTERTTNQTMTSESIEFAAGSLTFEAVYNDRSASSGQAKYNTGIDLNGVKIYLDGVDMTASAEVNSGSMYLAATGLKNGPHTLKVQVKDNYGNVTTGSYPFTVNDENGENSAVSVVPADEAASPVIGKDYTLNIVNNGMFKISSVRISLEIQSDYAEAWSVSFTEGYEGSAVYDKDTGCIVISADAKEGAELTDKVIASVSLSIPEDAAKGDQLKYAVSSGVYTTEAETASFAAAEKAIPLTALYSVDNSPVTAGFPCTFTVTDNDGKAVEGIKIYSGETELGVTDENGALSYTYAVGDSGRKTIYAKDETGRSWNNSFVVNVVSAENDGAPYGIQNNAVKNADTCQSITWFSAIGDKAEADSIVRLSTDKDMTGASEVKGSNEFITFTQTDSGIALRINKVLLKDLTPSTTYYYQVGDGGKWSETLSFTTASGDSKAATNFFVFADIQSTDTANLNAAIQNVTGSDIVYSFGVQTGDAIDNVQNYTAYWRPYLTEMNGAALAGINMIHVLGNHEYYGDIKGETSKAVFDLPESAQGSYYSFEYGNVYVGVINNGGSVTAAVEEMKADAAKSDCAWKAVVLHEPIYGTESTMADETRLAVTKAMEDAGIDVVFSGDDHAYARTFPMLGDKVSEDESEGVVYYIAGDLSSKDNEYHAQDYFAKTIPHAEYGGMYLSVQADADKMLINAYKYDGTLLDSYAIEKTDCEKGNHSFTADSEYNMENQTLTCTVCGEEFSAETTGMSGMFKVKGSSEDKVILAEGRVKTGWFQWGEETVHAGDDGILHKTVSGNTATCTENGHYYAKCETCGASYTGAATWSTGHDWDENHVCKTCGTVGVDINSVEAKYGKYYAYTGGRIYPSVTLTYEGRTLSVSSDRTGKDAYKSYGSNVNVGIGTVSFEGRGDFYGTLTLEFQILPANVSGFKAAKPSANSVKMSWDKAAGAQEYILQKYNPDTEKWDVVKITGETEYTVTGLDEGSYSFRVYCRAEADGKQYYCSRYSPTVNVSIKAAAADNISCTVLDGRTVMLTETDDGFFLLLPAGTDMSKLIINADSIGGELSIAGDRGSAKPGSSFDIEAVASAVNGAYTVTLTDGELSQKITIRKASAASMFITSDDAENKGREYVDASKDNSTTGKMLLVGADGSVIYDGSLTQLKARGNSTFTYAPKKSYQIKLDPKNDLLGNGEKVKTWVLLANYNDPTMLHDKLFKDLAADLGMYSADCDWVDLYYDGEYRGTYLLSEKNSIGETGVDITDLESEYKKANDGYGDNAEVKTAENAYGQTYYYTKDLTDPENITGGYLLEVNGNDRGVDDASGFSTVKGYEINVKSPEWASQTAMKYISEYYQEFENAVYAKDADGNYTGYNEATGKYYYDYCDLDSLVKMYLIQELSASTDAFHASLYFYKDADGKLCAGPVWDMDLSLGSAWDMKVAANNSFVDRRYLAEALINIPGFQKAVKEYFVSQFKTTVEGYINTGIGAYADALQGSAEMNFTVWPYVNIADPSSSKHIYSDMDYATAVSNCKAWVAERLTYMQGRINAWGVEKSVFPDVSTDSVYYSSIVWAVDKGIVSGYEDGCFKPNASATRAQVVTMLWRAAGCPEPAAESNPFSDVSDTGSCAPYYKAILWANENGIALGYGDGSFRPHQTCTRAQVVTFLWRFAEEPECTAENSFSDVSDTGSCAPYYKAILWANENGIALGYGDGCFKPDQTCTRAQIVTFIARYLQSK